MRGVENFLQRRGLAGAVDRGVAWGNLQVLQVAPMIALGLLATTGVVYAACLFC